MAASPLLLDGGNNHPNPVSGRPPLQQDALGEAIVLDDPHRLQEITNDLFEVPQITTALIRPIGNDVKAEFPLDGLGLRPPLDHPLLSRQLLPGHIFLAQVDPSA